MCPHVLFMGSCHTVPAIISYPNRCMICWESIPENCTRYIKCAICNIMLHTVCGYEYKKKTTQISYHVCCPHCNGVDSLFIYDNELYSCESV